MTRSDDNHKIWRAARRHKSTEQEGRLDVHDLDRDRMDTVMERLKQVSTDREGSMEVTETVIGRRRALPLHAKRTGEEPIGGK